MEEVGKSGADSFLKWESTGFIGRIGLAISENESRWTPEFWLQELEKWEEDKYELR